MKGKNTHKNLKSNLSPNGEIIHDIHYSLS